MNNELDWRDYIDENDNFELASYIYKSIINLMKTSLDMGTLLSTDQTRLRAYKEQIKNNFKGQWREIAQALEHYDIIVPCGCSDEYCSLCSGARYRLTSSLSYDQIREIVTAVSHSYEEDPEVQRKLQEGLKKAIREAEAADV